MLRASSSRVGALVPHSPRAPLSLLVLQMGAHHARGSLGDGWVASPDCSRQEEPLVCLAMPQQERESGWAGAAARQGAEPSSTWAADTSNWWRERKQAEWEPAEPAAGSSVHAGISCVVP